MFDKQRNSKFGQSEAKGTVPGGAMDSTASQGDRANPSARSVAMIGTGIQINGDISGDENLVIDGKVEGSVKLNSNEVSVGQGGRVKANVSARVVRIEGRSMETSLVVKGSSLPSQEMFAVTSKRRVFCSKTVPCSRAVLTWIPKRPRQRLLHPRAKPTASLLAELSR